MLKPVSYGAFCTKLSRAIQRVQRRKGGQVALQLSGGGMQLLDTGDILYLETRNRMLYYHTATQEYAVRGSLAGAEKAVGCLPLCPVQPVLSGQLAVRPGRGK